MRRLQPLFLVAVGICLQSSSAHGMGFGRSGNPAVLGQPLEFSATVRLEADETLERACVFAEVDAGENRLAPDQVRTSLQRGAEPNERVVRVTTVHLLDEPVVTVNLTVGCGARISRRFVTFLDPPVLRLASSTAVDAAPDRASRNDRVVPVTAAVLAARDAVPDDGPSTRRTPPSAHSKSKHATARHLRPRSLVASRAPNAVPLDPDARPSPRHVAGAGRMAARSSNAAGGSRLQLETAPTVMARAPEAAASAALVATLAAAASNAAKDAAIATLQAEVLKERDRIQVLEAGIARIGTDAHAMQQGMAALQARLKQADSERYSNPLIYVLAGICALLAAIVAFGGWYATSRRKSHWSDLAPQSTATGSAAGVGGETDSTTTALPRLAGSPATPRAAVAEPVGLVEETAEDAPWVYRPPRLPVSASSGEEHSASSIGGLDVTTVLDPGFIARMGHDAPAANIGFQAADSLGAGGMLDSFDSADAATPIALSMESLIDLDQQVEFCVVLGRDDTAAELLVNQLRVGDAVSPLLYFRLLEIHRRRDDRAAHSRVAEAFHERFGALAPSWEAAGGPGPALADYPSVVERLQSAWSVPAEAMKVLDELVFQRRPADEMLDRGAYREMLFLYSVARELAEGPPADAVDLLLPIDGSDGDLPAPVEVAPSHFAELYALPSRPAPLDFDISVAEPLGGRSELRKAV